MLSLTQLPTSFIDNLDDDCLSEIFAFANLDWDSHHKGTRNMFFISKVSRRWRNVALSRAELWATMIINQAGFNDKCLVPGGESSCNPLAIFPTASLMLKRSRQHPLNIYIKFEIDFRSSFRLNDPQVKLLATLLTPHVDRISYFSVFSPSREHPVILTNIFAGKTLPLLRSLQIVYTFAHEKRALMAGSPAPLVELPSPLTFPLFDSTPASHPNLTALTLQGIFCNWANYSVRHSLTDLALGMFIHSTEPTAGQLFDILRMSKDTLRTLRLGTLPRGPDPIALSITVELPCLEYLAMVYTEPLAVSGFVNHIRVPALKRLDIVGRDPEPDIPDPAVYADTLEAFQHVMDNLPLSQVEAIHLGNLCFGPGPAPGDLVHGEQLPVPYEFFQRLRNVQDAQLNNPSRYLLDAANYGRAPNVVAMPKLRLFASKVRRKKALEELIKFLRDRKALGALQWRAMHLRIPLSLKQVVCACPEIRDTSVPTSVLFLCYHRGHKMMTFGPSLHRSFIF